ncbi:prostaglandin F2-alpha receptor-like [Megalops cyprinoides]|uniref:prostaglandin F2-alpha receptor-like n=1 Tax=Megalops cyprinoides TaxID=118141 RepID=UPI0018655B31|nr:prostaglandin F2-alpha receptor-like [Megalops cyprinoides]
MTDNRTSMEVCTVASTQNSTGSRQPQVSPMTSVVSMSVGIMSNMLALIILVKSYRRFRLKTKASFLLFASGLVMTNFLGHLINGSLALHVYRAGMDATGLYCNVFGACMVFFGLSPLLLGSTMAVERCFGITRPLFHAAALTSRRMKKMLGLVWLLAAAVALLPILARRFYHMQHSRSWCFFRQEGALDWLDIFLPLLFSGMGLLSLSVSILCNMVTGVTLLRSKLRSGRHRKGTSHHLEMVCQLLAIMLVSCICWAPLLVTLIIRSIWVQNQRVCGQMLLAVRMATWNQILDPWVYILLRRAVMKKVFILTQRCCSPRMQTFYKWNCSTFKDSMQTSNPPHRVSLVMTSLPKTTIKPVPCT